MITQRLQQSGWELDKNDPKGKTEQEKKLQAGSN